MILLSRKRSVDVEIHITQSWNIYYFSSSPKSQKSAHICQHLTFSSHFLFKAVKEHCLSLIYIEDSIVIVYMCMYVFAYVCICLYVCWREYRIYTMQGVVKEGSS